MACRLALVVACAALCAQSCTGLAGSARGLGVRAPTARSAAVTMTAGKVAHYATDGKAMGEVSIELRTSAKPMYVVHRKVLNELNARRQGTASAKTRSEVSGGGRKPYKQKGTGRARRGSTRSPLIVGGGAAHGPKPKDWSTKMNKKERRVATASAIMGVLPRAIVVDDLEPVFATGAKTKMMVQLLSALPLGMADAKKPKIVLIAKDKVRARQRAWG
jgi:large subunit ribosomal protein L4